MARRDNAPKRRKTNAELPSNINELVDKYKSPRDAWLHEMELLEKRIRNTEEKFGIRVDIEQLPKQARDYMKYSVVPNMTARYFIKEAKDLRQSDLLELATDQTFWDYDTPTAETNDREWEEQKQKQEPDYSYDESDYYYDESDYDVLDRGYDEELEIAQAEIDNLRDIINRFPDNPINVAMLHELEAAIAEDSIEEVAERISSAIEASEALAELAHKYKANSSQGQHHLAKFKAIISGRGITMEENELITGISERDDGSSYSIR